MTFLERIEQFIACRYLIFHKPYFLRQKPNNQTGSKSTCIPIITNIVFKYNTYFFVINLQLSFVKKNQFAIIHRKNIKTKYIKVLNESRNGD